MSNFSVNQTGYVPILRRRNAEMDSLKNLLNEDFKQITPLFEMCEHLLSKDRRQKLIETNVDFYFYDVVKELAACCGEKPYFIDFGNIEGLLPMTNGRHPLEIYFALLNHHFLSAIPVTGLKRTDPYQSAITKILSQANLGICLRLDQNDIRDPSLVPRIQLFLRNFNIEPSSVDLLVDLKTINLSSPSIEEICNRLPMLNKWRSFIVASGAFPVNLSEFDKHGEYEVARDDLSHWLRGIENRNKLSRIPTFSDYTIQSPKVPQPMNFIPNVSASIRYTTEKYWIIMRGEGLRNEDGAKFDQYWGQANSLMFRDEYSGEDFSFGDQYVSKIGTQTHQTGNPNSWLKAGINRHMTYTARQISQIFSSTESKDLEFRLGMRRPPLQKMWNQSRLVLPNSNNQGYLFPPIK